MIKRTMTVGYRHVDFVAYKASCEAQKPTAKQAPVRVLAFGGHPDIAGHHYKPRMRRFALSHQLRHSGHASVLLLPVETNAVFKSPLFRNLYMQGRSVGKECNGMYTGIHYILRRATL